MTLVVAREKCGDENKNRWEALRSCMMRCEVKSTAHLIKGNAQQERRCWGCSEVGHCLWACPKKAAHLVRGEAQPKVVRRTEVEKMMKEVKCSQCGKKGENMVWILESVARDKICPNCEKGKGKRIDAALSCRPVKFWLNK